MISLGQLERRLGWLSFPGFLRYYAIFQALVYLLQLGRPDLGKLLDFDRSKIVAGEVWRVVTFLFSSSGSAGSGGVGMMLMVFLVMIAFMMSNALEDAWGVFKTTLFFAVGIVGLIIGNFIFPQVMPDSGILLYGAAFFAFATLFPKVEFLLFFILPVQVRILAWIQAAGLLLVALSDLRLIPFFLLGHANYLLFAGIPALRGTARVLEAAQRKRRFNAGKIPDAEAFHGCAACERTEVTDPDLEFRVGRDGREYCTDHLPE
jgi:hypothetical protein